MSKNHIERTLIILKPDAIQRGIFGEILTRFEKVGLKIVGMKMIAPTKEQFHHHYEGIGTMITRHGDKIFNATVDFMTQGPVVIAVLEGVDVIALVRKLVGATEPKSAQVGTIRGDYSHISYGRADDENKCVPNIIHASADESDAAQEIQHWFKSDELYDYEVLHEKFTR